MKIISGKYKGRVINGFFINGTRPTMDRIKESVFAMIQDYIKDSIVLDLYSGSGNLAIEAISNGAKYAYLVDNNKEAIKMIKSNINMLNIDNAIIIEDDGKKALKKIINDNILFNIIFLDPPYNTNELDNILNILNENYNKINKDILIICETTLNIDYNKYNKFKIYKEKKYGDKIVTILKKYK
mgnify:CR=1 FL=1